MDTRPVVLCKLLSLLVCALPGILSQELGANAIFTERGSGTSHPPVYIAMVTSVPTSMGDCPAENTSCANPTQADKDILEWNRKNRMCRALREAAKSSGLDRSVLRGIGAQSSSHRLAAALGPPSFGVPKHQRLIWDHIIDPILRWWTVSVVVDPVWQVPPASAETSSHTPLDSGNNIDAVLPASINNDCGESSVLDLSPLGGPNVIPAACVLSVDGWPQGSGMDGRAQITDVEVGKIASRTSSYWSPPHGLRDTYQSTSPDGKLLPSEDHSDTFSTGHMIDSYVFGLATVTSVEISGAVEDLSRLDWNRFVISELETSGSLDHIGSPDNSHTVMIRQQESADSGPVLCTESNPSTSTGQSVSPVVDSVIRFNRHNFTIIDQLEGYATDPGAGRDSAIVMTTAQLEGSGVDPTVCTGGSNSAVVIQSEGYVTDPGASRDSAIVMTTSQSEVYVTDPGASRDSTIITTMAQSEGYVTGAIMIVDHDRSKMIGQPESFGTDSVIRIDSDILPAIDQQESSDINPVVNVNSNIFPWSGRSEGFDIDSTVSTDSSNFKNIFPAVCAGVDPTNSPYLEDTSICLVDDPGMTHLDDAALIHTSGHLPTGSHVSGGSDISGRDIGSDSSPDVSFIFPSPDSLVGDPLVSVLSMDSSSHGEIQTVSSPAAGSFTGSVATISSENKGACSLPTIGKNGAAPTKVDVCDVAAFPDRVGCLDPLWSTDSSSRLDQLSEKLHIQDLEVHADTRKDQISISGEVEETAGAPCTDGIPESPATQNNTLEVRLLPQGMDEVSKAYHDRDPAAMDPSICVFTQGLGSEHPAEGLVTQLSPMKSRNVALDNQSGRVKEEPQGHCLSIGMDLLLLFAVFTVLAVTSSRSRFKVSNDLGCPPLLESSIDPWTYSYLSSCDDIRMGIIAIN